MAVPSTKGRRQQTNQYRHERQNIFIVLLFVGILSAIIASNKGFAALRWVGSLGLVGLIAVLCLSSAKEPGITPEESAKRAAKANKIGAWMCGIELAFFGICLFVFMSAPPRH
jgi:hypothetical protein